METMQSDGAASLSTKCCIVGGGPAGLFCGFLLARSGVDVIVLEKHADFIRDFRGDTIHPSTLHVMEELGLLEALLALPHGEAKQLHAAVADRQVVVADFTRLKGRCRFIVFMPQWDLLNFIVEHAARYPGFKLLTQTPATDLIEEDGVVVGVKAQSPSGPLDIRADLVIAADGRHSTMRKQAGFAATEIGAPMDVLWFKLSKKAGDQHDPAGRFDSGRILVLINRGDHWQCGYVIAKGGFDSVKSRGIAALRADIVSLAPFLADRVDEIGDFDMVSLLSVAVDYLKKWRKPGLLTIGDSAHAMSPVGGVGINLAIQDAIATANALALPLRERRVSEKDLARIQRRREWPARATQMIQVAIQKRFIERALDTKKQPSQPPLALRLIAAFPALSGLTARLIGVGLRPENVRIAEYGKKPGA